MSNIEVTVDSFLLLDAAAALRYKAHEEAGMSQAPDLFEAEDTLEWSQALRLEAVAKQALAELEDSAAKAPLLSAGTQHSQVLAFNQKMGFPRSPAPAWLPLEHFLFHFNFLLEELGEFQLAYACKDMHKAADALVDLVYKTQETAVQMGLPWPMLWAEVHRKNMLKERASSTVQTKRGFSFDAVKPVGWEPPDHTAALGQGPWPTLEIKDES